MSDEGGFNFGALAQANFMVGSAGGFTYKAAGLLLNTAPGGWASHGDRVDIRINVTHYHALGHAIGDASSQYDFVVSASDGVGTILSGHYSGTFSDGPRSAYAVLETRIGSSFQLTVSARAQVNAADVPFTHHEGLVSCAGPDISISISRPSLPQALDDEYVLGWNGQLVVASESGVLTNDFDPNGDTLSAQLVDPPSHGQLLLNSDGSFKYVPPEDFSGSDSFTYKATDGSAESNEAVVTIKAPDVSVKEATTADSHAISALILVEHAAIPQLEIGFYYSKDSNFNADQDIPIGDIVTLYNVEPGARREVWEAQLPPNSEYPYVFVVVDPENRIREQPDNNKAYFRKYVLGAVTHGYQIAGVFTKWDDTHWVNRMADTLDNNGYKDTVRFNWLALSNQWTPLMTVAAGKIMANQLLASARQLINDLALSPTDVLDLHVIGHSRGGVVISQALYALQNSALAFIPDQLQRGFVKMTMLDPHPARNMENSVLKVWCDYDQGDLIAELKYFIVQGFQAVAVDPYPSVPSIVDRAEVFYQNTYHEDTPLDSDEQQLNLWGVTVENASNIRWTTDPDTEPRTGHSGVAERYLGMAKSLATTNDVIETERSRSLHSGVEYLFPRLVDDRTVAQALVGYWKTD